MAEPSTAPESARSDDASAYRMETVPAMLRCRDCGAYVAQTPLRSTMEEFGTGTSWDCSRCDLETPHDVLWPVESTPVKWRVECPNCGYETLLWDDPSGTGCPGCFDSVGLLMAIAGVGRSKAEALYEAGYRTVDDVREAGQDRLAEVPGIGVALAARIMADIGQPDDPHLPERAIDCARESETYVIKRIWYRIEATDEVV